jgi:hypothetical protein
VGWRFEKFPAEIFRASPPVVETEKSPGPSSSLEV